VDKAYYAEGEQVQILSFTAIPVSLRDGSSQEENCVPVEDGNYQEKEDGKEAATWR